MIVVELACAEVVCARIVRAPGDADAAPDHVHRRQLLFERDCLGELSLVIEGWVETIEVCRGQRRVLELNEHGPRIHVGKHQLQIDVGVGVGII